ncbi:hypothetical protein [Alkalicoccus chagannorensis]|uniref:hypothetical protein n=1 Tax=Alkalicoccus chagannorensis TaxID=427072 RepID=UPI0003F6CC73|nr:hypothetical protein [Alkalicoccus chagannorensis]
MTAVQADTYNCDDFDTGQEVWEFWEENGYSSENDPNGLDGDSDGVPCEGLTLDAGLEGQFLAHDDEMTGGAEAEANAGNDANNNNNDNHNNNNNNNNDADHNDNNGYADNNHNDDGNAMADTATSYPTAALFGLLAAAAGGVMLMRRRPEAVK